MVAGFVVLFWANIMGNIISAEKRCNYPGRSRVTQLVYYNSPKIKICLVCRCSHSKPTCRRSCLIVSTDVGLKLFISTVIPFSHASQFGLALVAVFYR